MGAKAMSETMPFGNADVAEEPVGWLTGAYTDHVLIERPEIGPPSTVKPDWMMRTAIRIRELSLWQWRRIEKAPRVPQDTLAFAFITLAQILPPSAPPPIVSARGGGGLQLQWDIGPGILELAILKPNQIVVAYLGEIWRASNDFNKITEIFWERFQEGRTSLPSISDRIQLVWERTSVDPEYSQAAQLATRDAAEFARREFPNSSPHIELSDDGVLTLQWVAPEKGLILVFTGDGTATHSIKTPGRFYATSGKEFELSTGLPVEVRDALREIDGG
jgi:hypothetical protein